MNDIIERLDRIEQVLALLLAAVVDEQEIERPASLDVDAPLPEGLYVLNSPDGSAPPF